MEIGGFTESYKDRLDLSSIAWEDFPMELQEVGLRFMARWKEELSTRHLRELSGFDDMSVQDFLVLAEKEEGSKTGDLVIYEVYNYEERAAGIYKAENGEEYDFVFQRTFHNGSEKKEVMSMEKCGVAVAPVEPVWKELERRLEVKK